MMSYVITFIAGLIVGLAWPALDAALTALTASRDDLIDVTSKERRQMWVKDGLL